MFVENSIAVPDEDAWRAVEELCAAMGIVRAVFAVGRCTLNQVDPYPITYSLSNP